MVDHVGLIGVFRVIGGIGWIIASVIAPAYIAETSPPRIRGRLGSLQLAIVTGIFVSLAVDYLLAHLAGGATRILWLGAGGLALDVPDDGHPGHRVRRVGVHDSRSRPWYLVASHRIPEARKVLTTLLGEKNLEITLTRIQDTLRGEQNRRGGICVNRAAASTASSRLVWACRSSSSSWAST